MCDPQGAPKNDQAKRARCDEGARALLAGQFPIRILFYGSHPKIRGFRGGEYLLKIQIGVGSLTYVLRWLIFEVAC